MPAILKNIGKSVWANPHLVLALAAMMWGGHTIVARASVGEVSPMLLMALRWLLCLLILAVFLRHEIKRDWSILKPNLSWLMLMGGVGLAGFTIFFILAAQYTSAINLGIMQSSIPAFVILMSFLFLGKSFGPMQTVGLCLTIIGVVYLTCGGSFASLAALAINSGDLLMLVACLCYAGFAVGLSRKVSASPFVLLAFFSLFALVTLGICAIAEYLQGSQILPSFKGMLMIAYSGIIASLVGQLFFVRGVRLVGASRAGLYINLVPVFGALMAVMFLGESLKIYHGISLIMVLSGIYLVEKYKSND